MISFITGKPGDGKTLFGVRQLLEDLIKSELYVVTNIPLVMSRVNEYVTKRRTDRQPAFVLDERLKVIPDAEVYEFYRHRSGGLVLPWSPDKAAEEDGTKRIPRADFVMRMKEVFLMIREKPEYCKPVNYYIDEAHNFFASREWATNGRGLLYYASQHRHLWDNIYLITQVMENVEKQLRSLVSETHQVRNQLRRRIGPIQMRPVFRVSGYYGVPAGTMKPFAVTAFDLEPEKVGACYKTVGALGVHDTPEKTQNKAPFPWWVLPVGGVGLVVVVGVLMALLPVLGMKAGAGVVKGALGATTEQVAVVVEPVMQGHAQPAQPVMPQPYAPRSNAFGYMQTQDGAKVVAYSVVGAAVRVELSDGRVLDEKSPALNAVGKGWVRINGEKIYVDKEARYRIIP